MFFSTLVSVAPLQICVCTTDMSIVLTLPGPQFHDHQTSISKASMHPFPWLFHSYTTPFYIVTEQCFHSCATLISLIRLQSFQYQHYRQFKIYVMSISIATPFFHGYTSFLWLFYTSPVNSTHFHSYKTHFSIISLQSFP